VALGLAGRLGLADRLGTDHADATAILRAALRVLGDHLPAGEAALLAAELPDELAPEVRHPGPPAEWDGGPLRRTPIVGDLAGRLGVTESVAERYLCAVLDALAGAVPSGLLCHAAIALTGLRR
jgi:uncharacterized protein (DUF2267 family)